MDKRVRQLRLVVEAEDFAEAVAFYRDVLGLPEEAAFTGDGDARVVILDAGRATLEIANPAQKRMIDEVEVGRQVARRIRVAFEVDDAVARTEEATAAGAVELAPPTRTPWDSLNARLEAPAGLQITLFQELGADLGWMREALHVSNGDSTDLAGTGLAERILYWRDSLHEGPVPAVGDEELRRIRAEFLSRAGVDDRAEGAAMFAERDRVLTAGRDGEYVLWFEADLYDQLQIIQILDRLAGLGVPAQRITLICIGEHAGIARFGGLGQLTAAQLRELPATNACIRLTPAALELATRAWAAFRAPTPDGLRAIVDANSAELRFLGEAFDRLSREYPATRDGLSLAERRILAAVAAGASDAGTAFVLAAARETRPYLGDSWSFAMMDRMAHGSVPLLEAEPADRPVDRSTGLRLTEAGAQVLAGAADQVALNGIDRWVGGVHLSGRHVPLRWDDGTENIVRSVDETA